MYFTPNIPEQNQTILAKIRRNALMRTKCGINSTVNIFCSEYMLVPLLEQYRKGFGLEFDRDTRKSASSKSGHVDGKYKNDALKKNCSILERERNTALADVSASHE